ncbi:6,7-dimethyl-8-ribityllumazine synthase [Streptomyces flavidovirens]
MARRGAPGLAVPVSRGLRVAVAVTRWHTDIVDTMLDRALSALREAQVQQPTVAKVPGALELPLMCQHLAKHHDAVVALGVIMRGDTPVFDHICATLSSGLLRVSLDESTPVGNGVLKVEDETQAWARSGSSESIADRGHEAVVAALCTAHALRDCAPPTLTG